ncbi:hypothetical protein ACHAXR_012664 [Thalassiosira sp. AJA248-18]
MESSSLETTPVKLPVPPATPSLPQNRHNLGHNIKADSIAARALAALEDDDEPSSLDVHIRWVVESGSIVQKGEKIAQLFYSCHGSPPPPPSMTSSANNGIIRARPKKKRWSTAMPSADTSNNTAQAINALPKDTNFVSLEIRSPSNGFLRVLYKKSLASNAVQINQSSSTKYSVINLILAAIEACEHPAVVGDLCAVCGADTRAPKNNDMLADEHIPHKHRYNAAKMQSKGTKEEKSRIAPVGMKQQKIIEQQKKLAASLASAKEFDDDDDDEFACFDMDAAIASHAEGTKQPPPKIASNPVPEPKITKPTGPSTGMRSLSSLLSGAKATQKMQIIPTKQKSPPQRRHVVSRRPLQTAASSSTSLSSNNSTDDPTMSKMTVSGGVTITISESEAKNISDANSKKLREEKKLCLVLDLDHTLLHATDDYRAGRFVADEVMADKAKEKGEPTTKPNPDMQKDVRSILLPVELDPATRQEYVQRKLQQQEQAETNFCLEHIPPQRQGAPTSIIMRHFVKLRPHLKELFSQIQSTYQLSVYTAGTRTYAEQVAVMICRHLVDAPLDEEGLNALRAKVREKDDECRKYREYKARVGRKRQLELAKDRESKNGNGELEQKNTSRKSVSFAGNDKSETANDDRTGETQVTIKSSNNLDQNATNSVNKKDAGDADSESKNAADVGECTESSSKKRSKPSENGEVKIPRKKKRMNSGSLLTLIPTKTESSKEKPDDSLAAEADQLVDPSEERDRLRKELEEAEQSEIAAVELRRKLFGSRIVSRTDVGDLGKDVKSLKRVFPCGGVMAAILDDREDVWANAKNNATGRPGEPPDNLLLVKPYHWKPFNNYADVNNASGQDLSKTDDSQRLANDKLDGKEDDVQLLWTADILRRLHERYYSTTLSSGERENQSVPSLLHSMRKETFLRFPQVRVVFSGLIPINKQKKHAQVRPLVVRYAEELGAEVISGVSSEVTHVVAARDGSEKIRQARKEVPGCYIVHTAWLMECYWSISRRDIRPYHMGPMPSSQHSGKHRAIVGNMKNERPAKSERSKDNVALLLESDEEESDEDDFDDVFAADLEKEMMKSGRRSPSKK